MYKVVRSLEEMEKIRKSFRKSTRNVRHATAKSSFLKRCKGIISDTRSVMEILRSESPFR